MSPSRRGWTICRRSPCRWLPRWNPRRARCRRTAPRPGKEGARGTCRRAQCPRRRAGPDRESRSPRPPRQHRGRMSLEALPETAVSGHQLLIAHHPGRLEQRVEKRRGVTLGEDEMVVGRGVGVVPVVAQMTRHQHRDQVSRRHARGGMTGACARRGPDRVDPELRRQLCDGVEVGQLGHGFGRHGGSLGFSSSYPKSPGPVPSRVADRRPTSLGFVAAEGLDRFEDHGDDGPVSCAAASQLEGRATAAGGADRLMVCNTAPKRPVTEREARARRHCSLR